MESLYGDVACYEDFITVPGILASSTHYKCSVEVEVEVVIVSALTYSTYD